MVADHQGAIFPTDLRLGDLRDYEMVLRVASMYGRVNVVNENVDGEWLWNIEGVETVRAGRNYGTLLQAASARGHDKIVELLLVNWAEVSGSRGRPRGDIFR